MMLDALACASPQEVIVIEAQAPNPAEAAIDALLEPFQPLREQFMAITGIGLDVDEDEVGNAAPSRGTLDAGENEMDVSYLTAGDPDGRRVVFIHGSPGVAEEWGGFLVDVPEDQYRIAVDRPGFGETAPDAPVVDLGAQARLISPLLADDPDRTVLVGYSYGGPVALRLAADHPDRVGGVLLVGSAADPTEEEVHPLQSLAAMEMFSGLLPSELSNSNAELLALKEQLYALADDLGRIRAPVTILQGMRDTLVPMENSVYLQRRLTGAAVRVVLIEEGDHFLPWTHSDLLKEALDCVISDSLAGQDPARGASGRDTGDSPDD